MRLPWEHFYKARSTGDPEAIQRLKACSANFEIHTNGFFEQWQGLYDGKLDDAAIREIDKVFSDRTYAKYIPIGI